MAIVAGVDFGTLSVRVSIVDSQRGRLGSGTGEYPLHRKKEDPDHATQSHADHMSALVAATRNALEAAGVAGEDGAIVEIETPSRHRLARTLEFSLRKSRVLQRFLPRHPVRYSQYMGAADDSLTADLRNVVSMGGDRVERLKFVAD